MRTDRLCGVQRFKSKSRTGGEASECRVAENSTTEVFCKFQCQCSPVMYEQQEQAPLQVSQRLDVGGGGRGTDAQAGGSLAVVAAS